MKRNNKTMTSCHRSQEIGAGCSQSSHPRCGGRAIARGTCKQAPGSVSPAPLYDRRQTDRQTDNRQTDSSRQKGFRLCALPCGLCAPLCRGGSGRRPVRGRCVSVAGCPGALCGLRHDSAPCPPSPSAVCSVAGAVCPAAGCPGARCGLRHDLAPASRLRGCALRSRLAKRLRAYQVPYAPGACVSGPAGLFVPPFARALPPFGLGVIL